MKILRNIYFFTPMLVLSLLFGCTSTLYVAPKLAECTEGAGKPCYLIRTSQEGNWVLHNATIAGLEYEEGFAYTLKVKRASANERAQNGSDAEYTIVTVMEKKDATDAIVIDDLMDKEWKLETLKIQGQSYAQADQPPTMTFTEEGRITGFAGCNRYFGSYTIDGRTIACHGIGTTKMFCDDTMGLEDNFLKVISLPMRALFSNGKLILNADQGAQMIFRYK